MEKTWNSYQRRLSVCSGLVGFDEERGGGIGGEDYLWTGKMILLSIHLLFNIVCYKIAAYAGL